MDRSHSWYYQAIRLEENLGAASLQLATDDLREIEDATMAIKVQGARYPEELLKMTGL